MGTLYLVANGPMPTTAPLTKVTTDAAKYTQLQIVPAVPTKIVAWGVSLDGSALASGFPCDLIETGTVAATVTAYATADVMPFDDPNAPANTSGTSGTPLNLGTALSGYTSSAEGSATVGRLFDAGLVDPVAGYMREFSLGVRPGIKVGNVCRLRIKGDGTVKCYAWLLIEV